MTFIGQLTLGTLADVLGAPLTAGASGAVLFVMALLLAVALYNLKEEGKVWGGR